MDQLGEAVKAFKAAQAGVPKAEKRAREQVAEARAKVRQTRQRVSAVVVEEYERGALVGELAKRVEVSRETIRRWLRAAGVEAG